MKKAFYQSIDMELNELKAKHRLRELRSPESLAGLINLSSNDYLGISRRQDWLSEFLDSAPASDFAM
ncbi:MAG: hypothetical protein PHO45_04235, partial [Victivallaceae bacterium]|nr:hypothetical protein [Victivallaceae bacterium]